jgi:hypothetical protein
MTKILLKHPQGKKGVSIEVDLYINFKNAILEYLSLTSEANQSQICKAIEKYFDRNQVKFEGSIQWYCEWVKLDLESNNLIERIPKTSLIKYKLVN